MTAAIETSGLSKRYRRHWALRDCDLSIPAGQVAGLVGPNGAGKTTLLNLAVGLLAPTSGSITVLGGHPADGQKQLAKVGFVAQDTPAYPGLSVANHLRAGAWLNVNWDAELARKRIEQLGLNPNQKAGSTLKANNSLTFIRMGILLFPTRGITPIGYAAFAFTLGVTAGVLIRRTIPAMAVTLAAFAAIQIAWAAWVRQHLIAPAHKTVALTAANISYLGQNGSSNSLTVYPPASANSPGSLILATQTLTPDGRVFNAATVPACRNQNPNGCVQALAPLHLHDLITYQPGSRFWPLQWYETALFLVLTAVLATICLWRIRRHAA
jgi:hypothetical protein